MSMPKILKTLKSMTTLPPNLQSGNTYTAIPTSKMGQPKTTTKSNLTQLVIDPDSDYIIRLAMRLLPQEENPENVMRLFISSVATASGLSMSKLRATNGESIQNYSDIMERVTNVLTDDQDDKPNRLRAIEMPVPSWYAGDPVTADTMQDIIDLDPAEVSAFAGSLCMAVTKKPTAENIEAFISKRSNLATLGLMSGEPQVFTENSNYLNLELLTKVNKAASFYVIPRELTMRALATNIGQMEDGNQYVFACFLAMIENTGMNSLTIIRKVLQWMPNLPVYFPHWKMEILACSNGISRVMALPPAERSFCKAIYGSKFIPVQYSDISHILGICVYIGSKFEPTLANFKGGVLSDVDRSIVDSLFTVEELEEETQEEGVEEQQPAEL